MLKLAIIFAFFAFAFGSTCSGNNSTCLDGRKLSCDPFQTECALGCCPIQDAVCCSDGYECCPPGSVCIPYVGLCIRLESSGGKTELKSEATVAVKKNVSECPPDSTTCPSGCCPLPNAICCADSFHCCPNGYKCTAVGCVKSSEQNSSMQKITFPGMPFLPQNSVLKECPGENHRCPTHKNCCINDDGLWECCDKPPLTKGKENCCGTISGYACCAYFQICTFFGCL